MSEQTESIWDRLVSNVFEPRAGDRVAVMIDRPGGPRSAGAEWADYDDRLAMAARVKEAFERGGCPPDCSPSLKPGRTTWTRRGTPT